MEFNAKAYPWYYAACSFIAWFPVFFLYFNSKLDLQDVLLLESVYYISVVLLEVPTGYFSDVVGRRKTLFLGALFLCIASVFFLIGNNFLMLAIGQVTFAFHMSMVSGTNTVFHYESLQSLSIEKEYGDREAIVNKYGMLAGGTAALVGGGLSYFDMRLAYVATFIAAVSALIISLKFKEPLVTNNEEGKIISVRHQMNSIFEFIKMKPIGWIVAFYICIFGVSHIPYEFYQPYIRLLDERDLLFGWSVPVISGLIYAGARYVGAIGAAYSMKWSRSIGVIPYLLFCLLAMNFVVGVMGLALSNILLLIVLMRSIPWAAIKAPINAIITPRIDAGQRATFHSIISLLSRLTFFITLLVLSLLVEEKVGDDWSNLRKIILVCFAAGMLVLGILWITRTNHTESTEKQSI